MNGVTYLSGLVDGAYSAGCKFGGLFVMVVRCCDPKDEIGPKVLLLVQESPMEGVY